MMVFDENFFVLVPTVIFVILAYKPIKKALISFLDDRAAGIKTQLEEAAQLKAEADAALTKAQAQERDMQNQTKLIVEQAKAEIENQKAEAKATLEDLLRRKEQAAFTRIASMEREATQHIQDLVADVTIKAVHALLDKHLPTDVAQDLVANAISTLPQDMKKKVLN